MVPDARERGSLRRGAARHRLDPAVEETTRELKVVCLNASFSFSEEHKAVLTAMAIVAIRPKCVERQRAVDECVRATEDRHAVLRILHFLAARDACATRAVQASCYATHDV